MSSSIEAGALSGAFVLRHREILRELFGVDQLKSIYAELSPEAGRELAAVTGTSWVPVAAVEELFTVAARRTGRTPASLHAEVGAIASERTIRTMWRVLMRFTTDAQLVSQTPVLYRKAWNRGTLTTKVVGPGHASITLSSWPEAPEFTLRGIQITTREVLIAAGRDDVEVTFERTSDGAVHTARWKK